MEKRTYPPLGTVSHGTMRAEDLIPAFMDVLREYAPERAAELEDECPQELEDGDYPDAESASMFADSLVDELNEIAPPYAYFGASEGDGSDYGFWPSIDSLEDDARYENGVVKVNDGDEWEFDCGSILKGSGRVAQCVGTDIDYVMSVSDHGNVTLYDARTRAEIWAVV